MWRMVFVFINSGSGLIMFYELYFVEVELIDPRLD